MEVKLRNEGICKKSVTALMKLLLSTSLIMIAFTFTGCSVTNMEIQGQRDPKELYDRGVKAYLEQKYEEAEKNFKALIENHPLSPYSLEAELMLGDICYTTDKYDDASSYYTNFVALHPTHPRAPYALFQKGMSHFKDVLSVDRDQTATRKALFVFQDLVSAYPDSPYRDRAKELIGFLRRRLAEREFYVADFYFKSKNYKGALSRFRDILKNYPEVGLADKTLYYIGISYAKLGEKGLARDTFSDLISKFPDSPFVKDARGQLQEG